MTVPWKPSSRKLAWWTVLLLVCSLVWYGSYAASRRAAAPRLLFTAGDPEASCGPASLAVVARWLGRPAKIAEINAMARVGDSGMTSLIDLRNAATSLGLHAQMVQLDKSRPFPWELPMILYLHNDHYSAAWPIGGDRLLYLDMPDAPRVWDKRWLDKDWGGVALVVAKSRASLVSALKRAGLR